MRGTVVAVLLGAALLLTGCAFAPGGDPRVEAIPVSAVACPDTAAEPSVQAGLVPDGFDAVAVLRCDPFSEQQEHDGIWSGALLERLEGDLEPVLTALATPSDARSLGPCPAIAYLVPDLWVERGDGDVVRVAAPSDGCGAPKEVGLSSALDALTVADKTFTRESLLESPEAVGTGCSTQAGVLVLAGQEDLDGADADSAAPGDQVIGNEHLVPYRMPEWPAPAEVTGARLCDYTSATASDTAPAPVGSTGLFTGARELAEPEARALVSDAQESSPAPSCTEVATQFVVVHVLLRGDDESAFTVETDGCRRLITPSLQAHVASADVLAVLTLPR